MPRANVPTSGRSALAAQAGRIWRAGLAAADPLPLMQAVLRLEGDSLVLGSRRIALEEIDGFVVVGAGKAAARMSSAVATIVGAGRLRRMGLQSCVNVPAATRRAGGPMELHVAGRGHENRPTGAGLVGTRRIRFLLERQGPRGLALCLISGGGSALLPGPAPGIRLSELRRITSLLHDAGVRIDEANAVRKHLSTVKGGGLLRSWRGRWLTAFVLSDIVGDPLEVIASGPTSPDSTTYADAIDILHRYGIWGAAPESVRAHLLEGQAGRRAETLKNVPPGVDNIVIGGPRTAFEGAAAEARRLGYQVVDLSTSLEGEASQAGRRLAAVARSAREEASSASRPICLMAVGETTVRLGRRPGRGGRAQELALAAFSELGGDFRGVALLAAGTDGEDGPTDAAGAIVDERMARRALARQIEPQPFLERHNSYNFFVRLGGLWRTGPTGTNVTDLVVLLVAGSSEAAAPG